MATKIPTPLAGAPRPPKTPAQPDQPEQQPVRTQEVANDGLTIGVLVLAGLAVVGALYVGKEIVLPIVFAIMLKLLLQPIMNFLTLRLRLPYGLSAFVLIVALFGAVATVAFMVSGPASSWVQKAPQVLPTLKDKLAVLRKPIDYMQGAYKELEDAATPSGPKDDKTPAVVIKDNSAVASRLAWMTATVVTRFFTTMVILFFLLAAGERLLRGLIEVLPRLHDKRQAVDIANETQHQIGGYLLTITLMNSIVGVVTGLAMWACGLTDPILWGAAAFLLQYVPILQDRRPASSCSCSPASWRWIGPTRCFPARSTWRSISPRVRSSRRCCSPSGSRSIRCSSSSRCSSCTVCGAFRARSSRCRCSPCSRSCAIASSG